MPIWTTVIVLQTINILPTKIGSSIDIFQRKETLQTFIPNHHDISIFTRIGNSDPNIYISYHKPQDNIELSEASKPQKLRCRNL